MNETEVSEIVDIEVRRARGELTESHHIDLQEIESYLVSPPYLKAFLNPVEEKTERHWVVMDENRRSANTGYLVFYSEADQAFGLGTKTTIERSEDAGTFIGIYGSLGDTLTAM